MRMAGMPFRDARNGHARGSNLQRPAQSHRGGQSRPHKQKLRRERELLQRRMEKYEEMLKEQEARIARKASNYLARKEQMRLKAAGTRRINPIEFHRIQAVACARRVPAYTYCYQWNSSCGCDIDHAGSGLYLLHKCIRCGGDHPFVRCRAGQDLRMRRGEIECIGQCQLAG